MAEDTRLNIETSRFNDEVQHHQRNLQPSKSPSTSPQTLLKETSTNNNIDHTIMTSHSEQIVLDYLLTSEKGEILKENGRELKKLKIGDKTYNYDKTKPLTDRLKRKLTTVKQTMGYKKYELETKRGIKWTRLDKNKALVSIQKRFKADITDEQSAFKNYVNSYSISNIKVKGVKALQYLKYQDQRLKEYLNKHKGMKIIMETFGTFKSKKTNEDVRHSIRSRRYEITNAEEIVNVLSQMATDIEIQTDKMELSESGLVIKLFDKIKFSYDKYNPTRGGSFIELPKWVQTKKACINIENKDDMCFKYSVQCGVHKVFENDHPNRLYHYKKIEDMLNWDNVNFPSSNIDIDTFEENNNGNIAINVYFLDDEEGKQSILLYRRSKVSKATHQINLLKLEEGNKSHYVYIKNYDRLIGCQTSKKKAQKHHCFHCGHGFQSEDLLEEHIEKGCMAVEGQTVEMPDESETMVFKNHYKKLKAPFVIYADFECLTTKTGTVSTKELKTDKYQHHRPCGFMINVVNSIDGSSEPFLYRGEDCMDVFVQKMIEIKDRIMNRMKESKEIIMRANDWRDFKTAKQCFICGNDFKDGDKKVRDHCHFTGKYRGCAHDDCNLQFSMRYYKIPVFLHNLKNYDSHLIIERANQLSERGKIDVIALNSEKFITFAFKNMCFKDSFSFLSSSLDKLVKLSKYEDGRQQSCLTLGRSPNGNKREHWQERFKFSKRNPYVSNDEDLDLLTDKGVYPYDYFDCFEKFDERQLPPKKEFYSNLTKEHIEDEEYERAKKIWEHFGIRNLGQYHDLYLKTDVLLLTDVFENFRDLCLEYYGLDPAHYFTLPNFAWDAMLLKTGVEIEPLTDQEMYEMIEKGLRGGMCQVSHKEAKANNKYMNEDYDETKASNFINYLDANNLYGLAMSMKLPIGKLKWIKKMLTEKNILDWNENDDNAYILEVDLEYPKELHDEHSDYPLAPENMNVKAEFLSEHQMTLHRHYYNGKEAKDEKQPKLILNVMDKEKYVVHIKALQYCLNKGMKLKQIHRVVKFKQRSWLKPWIDFNTGKRKEAKSDFEKDMFKLMNNAVYGKTMENVRNHIDFELVSTQERMQKCINSPTYKNSHIINDELVGVAKIKNELLLNKPIYVGMSILDLSKVHMYSFFYDVLKAKYEKNIRLIYTDTDSYVLQTFTEDIYEDWKEIKEYMDFSGYDKNHPSYDPTNKKVLGKFKDEMDGKVITNFIALRPKMYCLKVFNEKKVEKKAKGVPKNTVKKDLDMKDYENTLHKHKPKNVNFNAIRSKNHQIYSINQSKVGLTSYDNKRYWVNDTESVPYGHYSITT